MLRFLTDTGWPAIALAVDLIAGIALAIRAVRLQRRKAAVGALATCFVAIAVGMLGTIWGLTRAFDAVSSVEASQKQALLSQGIAHAMNATALALPTAAVLAVAGGVALHLTRKR